MRQMGQYSSIKQRPSIISVLAFRVSDFLKLLYPRSKFNLSDSNTLKVCPSRSLRPHINDDSPARRVDTKPLRDGTNKTVNAISLEAVLQMPVRLMKMSPSMWQTGV